MKIELQLRGLQDDRRTDNPTVVVSATIQEGDMVTAGSQFTEEFSLPALADFLTESRSARTIDLDSDEAEAVDFDEEQPEPMSFEESMALDAETQAEEDAEEVDPIETEDSPDKNELAEELNPESAEGPSEEEADEDSRE